MDLQLRQAGGDDAAVLADMNHQLIEDEGSVNAMPPTQLERRMRDWLEAGWLAVLVMLEKNIVGYILFREQDCEFDDRLQDIFVRQFFIARRLRRQGLSARAFQPIANEFFADGRRIVLETLATNPGADAFWRRMGFCPYSTRYDRKRNGKTPPAAK